MEVSFTLPDLGNVSTQNWLIIATLVGAAILASIVTELYKRHYIKKTDVKLAKSWVAAWLTATSIFFTYLGHLLILATAGAGYFSGLPFVGEHFAAVVGIGYAIYSFRLNRIYQGVATWLGKWSKSDDDKLPESPVGNIAIVQRNQVGDERDFTIPDAQN